ncbi:RNA polymerase sigma-70 factor [Arenibaculum sp.]|jgi:RNA polymerase sigma-70 factor (ECF subfamily)|uniref:RNA polymerase sigma-70 factor n=1 Tax=Arenibaculum sp. TaxID=2865862 RepID=UPI002E1264AA|nr:RNA polymerase sigma-70 factor [Arenibaculum sp.]
MDPKTAEFERHRSRLKGIGYRMLGSVGDAEDLVQETFLRWHAADADAVRVPEAWLTTAMTRLCIDRLRASASERAAYAGPWLPEPAVEEDAPDRRAELASDLSSAFLLLLERLAPEERAAFLLREAFDVDYAEIARTLGRSREACRQMVHRARERVRDARPRFEVSAEAHRDLLRRYAEAARAQDEAALLSLFAEDATFLSDGGGKVWAARRPVHGAARIARMLLGVARKLAGPAEERIAWINGAPGLVTLRDGRVHSTTVIETDGRRILSMHRVLNPEKLRHAVTPAVPAPSTG